METDNKNREKRKNELNDFVTSSCQYKNEYFLIIKHRLLCFLFLKTFFFLFKIILRLIIENNESYVVEINKILFVFESKMNLCLTLYFCFFVVADVNLSSSFNTYRILPLEEIA